MPASQVATLKVGSSGRFHGIHYLHWEWSRFEASVRSRWRHRRVPCELVSDVVPWPAQILEASEAVTRGSGIGFAVTVDADVVGRGRYGHLGTLKWRLSVRRWVAVERLQ